jgi:integrase
MAGLTKRFIDSVQPESKEQFFWDDDLPGFGLRVLPSGYKGFTLQYRNRVGRTRRLSLGAYGKLTPDEARKLAKQSLGSVSKGEDPAQIRDDNRRAETLKELSEQYLERHAKPHKKPWSVKQDERLLDKNILPVLGRHKVKSITRADIAKFHHDNRETPIQANRCLALLSKMFNLAESWGLRPDGSNPCRHVKRYKENKVERYLTGEEMSGLGQVLSKVEAEGTEMPSAILAIRLLLFTGCRLSEILTLRWEDVDLEGGVIRLKDSKTGKKNVPIPAAAVDVFLNAPRVNDNPYVCFGGKPGGHLVGLQKIWERIRSQAGLNDVRHHDLRHNYATVGAAANLGLPVLGHLLGHTQASTTQRYAHLAPDPIRAAADEIANRIKAAMEKQPERQGKVIPFPGRK